MSEKISPHFRSAHRPYTEEHAALQSPLATITALPALLWGRQTGPHRLRGSVTGNRQRRRNSSGVSAGAGRTQDKIDRISYMSTIMSEHVARKLSFIDSWLTAWIFAAMAQGLGLV
jgi:hypothetical protein